jgi:hypothetical protein
MTDAPTGWPGAPGVPDADTVERFARVIDPEAFGLPSHVPTCGADYLTDRDEARDKATVLLAEVAALVQAGQEAMREACAAVAAEYEAEGSFGTPHAIAKLPLPDAPAALARIEAEAEARGMERAAGIVEAGKEVARTEGTTVTHTEVEDMAAEEAAAAIRAAAKEIKG